MFCRLVKNGGYVASILCYCPRGTSAVRHSVSFLPVTRHFFTREISNCVLENPLKRHSGARLIRSLWRRHLVCRVIDFHQRIKLLRKSSHSVAKQLRMTMCRCFWATR